MKINLLVEIDMGDLIEEGEAADLLAIMIGDLNWNAKVSTVRKFFRNDHNTGRQLWIEKGEANGTTPQAR